MNVKHNAKGVSPLFRGEKGDRPPARRGVLLLVILGLLAMFGLVAVAFVVLTGQALRSAQTIRRIGQYELRPEEIAHQAAMQALRGTNNPMSVMGPHSLLEDIYSSATVTGRIVAVQPVAGGQLIEFTYNVLKPNPPGPPNVIQDPYPQRRLGCVLTMLTGNAAGQSTHIAGVNPQTGRPQMLAFEEGVPALGDEFLINGTPFSGTGFGFNPVSGRALLNAWDPGEDRNGNGQLDPGEDVNGSGQLDVLVFPEDANRNGVLDPGEDINGNGQLDNWQPLYALAPNPTAFQPNQSFDPNNPNDPRRNYLDPAGPGGANEDYDAVDYQNMLLAAQIETGDGLVTIPSLHRPALVYYWINQQPAWNSWTDLPVELRRKIVLRPLREDHPRFDGSNPNFDPVNGPWDVDNDGVGEADGIWVDLGFPVHSTPDGRLFKPLISFLCLDLDGRLNLNAHGCLAQVDPTYYARVNPSAPGVSPPIGGPYAFANFPDPPPELPRGQGYGPAEINLGPLFGDVGNDPVARQAYSAFLASRYRASGVAGDDGDDPLSRNRWYEYGGNYWAFTPAGTGAYGTPPNPKGGGAIGLDPAGRPLYCSMGVDEQFDDPYELDLSQRSARGLLSPRQIDSPFTVAELERLLRPFDADATRLPSRLFELTRDPSTGRSLLHDHRRELTTESWDLPCPSVAISMEMLLEGGPDNNPGYQWLVANGPDRLPVRHVSDLMELLLIKKGAAPTTARAMLPHLLPPELLAGLKMDLNRPFGDGQDNDNDGVVDEPGEANEQLTLYNRPDGQVSVPFSYDPDGNLANSLMARQLYARHLYVLMMLLVDTSFAAPGWDPATWAQLPADQRQKEWAPFIAQWAVNVVDFRDRDSIMTPFEYDPEPFIDNDGNAANGTWDVDGNLATDDRPYLVWGCERPELLITETLAFHDRRTEDLDRDTGDNKTMSDDPPDDFDQRIKPQGNWFIELYNPWTMLEPKPRELYDANGIGVKLDATTQDFTPGATSNSPVWRLIVVGADNAEKDPDDPRNLLNTRNIERVVYFVDVTDRNLSLPPEGGIKFGMDSRRAAAGIAPILPGRYVVIGPGKPQTTGTSKIDISFSTGQGRILERRRIELTPDSDPDAADQVKVYSGDRDGDNRLDDDLGIVTIRPPVAVVINHPQRLSISEPDGGYKPYTGREEYEPAEDMPQDKAKSPGMWRGIDGTKGLVDNDRFDNVKVAYLQRLANPLLPHDALTNPYRTIDTTPIDLTCFNGITDKRDKPSGEQDFPQNFGFYARQRGANNGSTRASNNLWSHEPFNRQPKRCTNNSPVPTTAQDHYFYRSFHHTLGYLNDDFGLPRSRPPLAYIGDPPTPFPWLTWNNRPFVSHLELLLVPTYRSSKLLGNYRLGSAGAGSNPYDNPDEPYPHLLNFFLSDASGGGNTHQLHRLLEFVHVPSRFVGTETQGNPIVFADPAFGDHNFRPPFNRISRYRDPGRINLNTVFSEDVWKGLMNYFPNMDTSEDGWKEDDFVNARRGYSGNSILDIDANYPTRFRGVFRSSSGGQMVPLDTLRPSREVNATLLREDRFQPTPTPLFEANFAGNPVNDTDRNPYFRYQGLQRLGNLVTTRSNVYAIWITVGYFEVEPGTIDDVHPDGYRLGQELGLETGEVKRHRAFYIFDRSIPVGFQRGYDHNVEKAILLKRFIE